MSKVSIAVIGLHGFLGKHVISAIESGKFDSKIQYPIKAITRKSDVKSTDKIEYVTGEVSEVSSKLGSIDVIIELTGPNPEVFAATEKLAQNLKPKIYIPSQFGTDILQVDTYAPGFLALKTQHSENLRKIEGVKVVDVITALFAVPGAFLYDWVGAVGINSDNKVDLIGDINQKFNITKLEDLGNALLSISATNPKDLPDTLRISSQVITIQDVIDKYSKDKLNGEKLEIASKKSAEDGKKEFVDKLNKGFNPNDFLFYLQAIIAQGLDKGLYFSKLDNELINPNESIWKWGKF
ncbi:unnamed protein product [Candida verbasci]|uniref:NmrA-like domain-containing protein n=1 Tax=Candida verbasci TaxID=1227364 RepID=A0A9W4XC58_9ASCO|nr:unnamed protein product [Candida verbasci]